MKQYKGFNSEHCSREISKKKYAEGFCFVLCFYNVFVCFLFSFFIFPFSDEQAGHNYVAAVGADEAGAGIVAAALAAVAAALAAANSSGVS